MSALRLRRLFPVALLTLALAWPAFAGADASGPQLVGYLNAQRAAHGIPGDIVADAALSDGCAKHNRYSAANGTLAHDEQPGAPGYTPEGAAAAAQAVIYRGSQWTPAANPFESTPIHLHQLLSPYIDRLGAAENDGYGCATTLASTNHAPTPADTLFTYPADGTRGWRTSEIDREGPFAPGKTAGIVQGTRTGPTLYVLVSGPGISWGSTTKVLAASLTGPSGPAPLVTFDRTTPQVGGYLPAGAQLLARDPLAPSSLYTASVRLQVDIADGTRRELTKTWSFTTAGAALAPVLALGTKPAATGPARKACATRLRFAGVRRTSRRVRQVRVRASACRTTALTLTLRRGGRTALRRTVRVKAGTRIAGFLLPRAVGRGRYAVRATLGGATLMLTRNIPAPGR